MPEADEQRGEVSASTESSDALAAPRSSPVTAGWRRLSPDDGHAYARVVDVGDTHVYEGWEVITRPSGGHAVRFRLVVGPDFVARALEVDADGPRGLRRLSVRRNPRGQWWADGKRRTDLDGCLDIDVAATPLTNTPTIRRLDLQLGEATELTVAWVDIPSLSIGPFVQRYERVNAAEPGTHGYRYESGTFEAGLTTDPDGLVRDYEFVAERIFRR
jgi:hypothetical protein